MVRTFVLLLFLFVLTGCAKVAHLDQLLTLKAYSDNTKIQEDFVEQQDARFKKLLATFEEGRLKEYPDRESIRKEFGEPVFKRKIEGGGDTSEQWLYRYAVRYFDSEKVYLVFDKEGMLTSWEITRPPQEKASPGGTEMDDG